mgnify:CR=1 FL=1
MRDLLCQPGHHCHVVGKRCFVQTGLTKAHLSQERRILQFHAPKRRVSSQRAEGRSNARHATRLPFHRHGCHRWDPPELTQAPNRSASAAARRKECEQIELIGAGELTFASSSSRTMRALCRRTAENSGPYQKAQLNTQNGDRNAQLKRTVGAKLTGKFTDGTKQGSALAFSSSDTIFSLAAISARTESNVEEKAHESMRISTKPSQKQTCKLRVNHAALTCRRRFDDSVTLVFAAGES